MKISKENAERLQEIAAEMAELLSEYKSVCKKAMDSREYDLFKYRCLGNLEPGLVADSDWMTSGVDNLEEVAENALEEADGN